MLRSTIKDTSLFLLILSSLSAACSARTKHAKNHSPPKEGCEDPLAAILATLQCVADANITCASAGYNADEFVKLHNGIDTNTKIDSGGDYWGGAFSQVDFGFSYDHQMNIGPNRASVRYIEEVEFTDGSNYGFPPSTEYPWSYSFVQHEHALVSVDDDCRITLWDQYGDDAEQNYHYDASAVVFGILCSAGIYPPFVCEMYGGIAATEADGSDAEVVDYVEEEVEEVDEKDGSIVKRLVRRYIKSKADALYEGHRILNRQFPKKRKEKKASAEEL